MDDSGVEYSDHSMPIDKLTPNKSQITKKKRKKERKRKEKGKKNQKKPQATKLVVELTSTRAEKSCDFFFL